MRSQKKEQNKIKIQDGAYKGTRKQRKINSKTCITNCQNFKLKTKCICCFLVTFFVKDDFSNNVVLRVGKCIFLTGNPYLGLSSKRLMKSEINDDIFVSTCIM